MVSFLMDWLPLLIVTISIAVIAGYISRWLNREDGGSQKHTLTRADTPPRSLFDSVPLQDGLDISPGHPITVASYPEAWQAELTRIRLEQAGIPVFIADSNLVRMDWYYSHAIGGVKVQVPASFVDKAYATLALPMPRQNLQELEQQALESEADPDVLRDVKAFEQADAELAAKQEDWTTGIARPTTVCPACGSTDIYRTTGGIKIFFLSILIGYIVGILLPVAWRRNECSRCHTTWR